MNDPKSREDKAPTESEKILNRVARESETIGASSARRAANHFMAHDVDDDDRTELWGRRIGRGLSILFVLGLIYYLVNTYL